MGESSNIGSQATAQQQAQQQQLNTAVSGINKAFSGFTPAFYNNYQNQFLEAAGPQVGAQARSTGQQLDYSLADKGLTDSSSGEQLKSSLAQNVALQEQGVANQAQTASQALQQQIQGQQNTLISEAESATNPGAVAQQALGTASQFETPSTFAPLGPLFNQWGNTYLTGQYSSALTPYLTALSTQPLLYQNAGTSGATGGNY
jgi:hypothetical protein